MPNPFQIIKRFHKPKTHYVAPLLLCSSYLLLKFLTPFTPDPDRLYHLSISREIAIRGFILPNIFQLDDIGWTHYFPEKEFLFHILTGIGFMFGRESGAMFISILLGLAVILLTYFFSRKNSNSALLTLGCTYIFLFLPTFFLRLGNFKPMEIGLICTILIAGGFLQESLLLACVGAFLFPLSYHFLFTPFGLILSHLFFQIFSKKILIERNVAKKNKALKLAIVPILALATGVLVHPYFPSNLDTFFQYFWIARQLVNQMILENPVVDSLDFGQELAGISSFEALHYFSIPFFLFILSFSSKSRTLWLWMFSAVCWVLAPFSFRTLEIALPLSVITVSETFSNARVTPIFTNKLKRYAVLILLLSGLIGTTYLQFLSIYFEPFTQNYRVGELRHQESIEAVLKIPRLDGNQKVLNCGWEWGPYVFYLRPDLKFVDLLDPSYLYRANPEKWRARNSWRKNPTIVGVAELKDLFQADYLLCDRPLPMNGNIYIGKTGVRLDRL